MKKLLIVLSALVLTVAFAVPALAMDMYDADGISAKMESEEAPAVVFGGELTFGIITPFDSEKSAIGFDNSYVDVSVWPFDYNVVTFRLEHDGAFPTLGAGTWGAPYLYLTTDLGMWLDLPVGVKNSMGVLDLYSRKYEVTGHAYERTLVRSAIDPLSWKVAVDAGMATINAGIGLGENDSLSATPGEATYADIGVVVEIPEAGPVDLEAFYLAQDDPDLKGNLGVDAKLVGMIPMVDLAAGFMFDLVEDAAGDTHWYYGVGGLLTYSMLELGVSINGWDEDALYQLGIDAKVDLGGYGVEGGIGMSFASDDYVGTLPDESETFQGAEFGVWLEVNAAKWRAGYVISDQYYTYTSAVAGVDGGLFITCDVDL
jgi:hypothetical protein